MNTLTQNPNPVSQQQEADLAAFVVQDWNLRPQEMTRHQMAWIAVRALNRRGWLSEPEQEVVPFVFKVDKGGGNLSKTLAEQG